MEARLWEEWNIIWNEQLPNVLVGLRNNNIRTWIASITGPQDTPYYGGCFIMHIDFPNNYPQGRPIFTMVTKIFHVNISISGEVCLDILRSDYKPENRVGYMISCIIPLLTIPNPASAFNFDAKTLMLRDKNAYEEKARNMTREFAM